MTREKAIEVLKGLYIFNPLNFDRTTLNNTALDIAIESLEHKDEVQDKLLKILVESGIDIPCDYLCCESCKYDNPAKECWIKWAEAEVRAESEGKECR